MVLAVPGSSLELQREHTGGSEMEQVPGQESWNGRRECGEVYRRVHRGESERTPARALADVQERKESPVCIAVARRKSDQPSNMRMLWMQARIAPSEKPSLEDIKVIMAFPRGPEKS